MTGRLVVFLALVALPCFAVGADNSAPSDSQAKAWIQEPSHAQIKEWLKPEFREHSDEELEISDVRRIILKCGEHAFIASVDFPTRGRCCNHGILLARPALQEARQTHSLKGVSNVIYLSDVQILSGVVISGSFLEQGVLSGSKAILYFDGWDPVVIYEQGFGDNLGSCGSEMMTERSCYSEEVTWTFADLDGDETDDLLELIVNGNGEEADQLTWKTKLNAYLIKGLKLVPVSPHLLKSDPTPSQAQTRAAHQLN